MRLFEKRVTHEMVEAIYKISLKILSVFYLLSIPYLSMQIITLDLFKKFFIIPLDLTIFICSVVVFIASFKKEPSVFSLVNLSVVVSLTSAFPQMSSVLFYILPVILSLYSFDQKHVIVTAAINGVNIFNSSLFRSFLITKLPARITVSPIIYMSTTVMTTFETLMLIFVSVPLFVYFLYSEKDQWIFWQEKKEASADILKFCSAASIYHNRYLEAHIEGVKQLTKLILDGLREDGYEINQYYYDQIIFSVQFHDIGKLYIPPSILDKPGPLTEEEKKLIEEHPVKGLELIESLPKNVMDEHTLQICKNIVYQHHERRSGNGYPQGLKGDDIRYEAEIVAVADVLDALLAWRPYKAPMTWDHAMEVFKRDEKEYPIEMLEVVYRNKDAILKISNENNQKLQDLLKLDEEAIKRK